MTIRIDMNLNLKKPRLVFNEFGKPSLDVKETNQYMNDTIMNALKSVSDQDFETYKKMVQNLKLEEQRKSNK